MIFTYLSETLDFFFLNGARGVGRTGKLENDLIKGGMPRETNEEISD
jgi:hypothetical protein